MASIWGKDISILAGNLNSGRSYLITAVQVICSQVIQTLPRLREDISYDGMYLRKNDQPS